MLRYYVPAHNIGASRRTVEHMPVKPCDTPVIRERQRLSGSIITEAGSDMTENRTGKAKEAPRHGDARSAGNALLLAYPALTGKNLLDRILESESPEKLVEDFAFGDFFWLVKKIGADDSLPLLSLATDDQWQHLLDMEIWDRDHLDEEKAMAWLKRLYEADRQRTVRWLLSEGYVFAGFCLKKYIDILLREEDEETPEITEDYFTHDGVIYIGVSNEALRPFIEEMTKVMAGEHPGRYMAILQALPTIIPTETEEELYRLRSTRVAEQGFLPFDEALEIFSPLDEQALAAGREEKAAPFDLDEDESKALIPFLPLYQAEKGSLFEKGLSTVRDPAVMDRIRLEFAGICNTMIAAQGLSIEDSGHLVKTCREAAGYLNLAMERLCEDDPARAGRMMVANPLLAIYRVGFGYALKLRWRAEQWRKKSWFEKSGLTPGFWGDDQGGVLAALLLKKPMFFQGLESEEPTKSFAHAAELEEAEKVLEGLVVLDRLFSRLSEVAPLEEALFLEEDLTYLMLLFDFWSRRLLDLKASFSGISMDEARRLFRLLRRGEERQPYRMTGFSESFVNDFMAYAGDMEGARLLRTTLSSLWEDFRREYESVEIGDLDRVVSRFFLIFSPETTRTI